MGRWDTGVGNLIRPFLVSSPFWSEAQRSVFLFSVFFAFHIFDSCLHWSVLSYNEQGKCTGLNVNMGLNRYLRDKKRGQCFGARLDGGGVGHVVQLPSIRSGNVVAAGIIVDQPPPRPRAHREGTGRVSPVKLSPMAMETCQIAVTSSCR